MQILADKGGTKGQLCWKCLVLSSCGLMLLAVTTHNIITSCTAGVATNGAQMLEHHLEFAHLMIFKANYCAQ